MIPRLRAACHRDCFSDVRVEMKSEVEKAACLQPVPADGLPEATAAALNENVERLNALAPGVFPSKMSQGMIGKAEEVILDLTPLKRLGGVEDLKGAAVLLASDASAFITGQTIAVDGGMSAI
jgi:NAD(P)-dependent dehydrogenase (short-subunit alcohol dehydrogenase family)